MVTPEHTISYSYNADGLRTQKAVDGVQWEYVWDGDKLIYMYDGTAEWRFIYDAGGSIVGFMQGASTYFYKKNLQGDVISIFDNNFNEVVTYEYDSWGNLIAQGGSKAAAYVRLGKDNPIRYRGYFYDTDTGLYYLQSRYYNAAWGRFVNSDGFVQTGQGIMDKNMFSYCLNNPIMRTDPTGNCSGTFVGKCKICGKFIYSYMQDSGRTYNVDKTDNKSSNVGLYSEHSKKGTTNKSNKQKHEEGQARKKLDNRGEKGDARRKPNPNKRYEDVSEIEYALGDKVVSGIIAVGCFVGICYLVLNDGTGVGVIDDAAIVPCAKIIWDNVAIVVS